MSSRNAQAYGLANTNIRYITFDFGNSFPNNLNSIDSVVLTMPSAFSTTNASVLTLYAGTSAVESNKLGTTNVAANTKIINCTLSSDAVARLRGANAIYAVVDSPSYFKTGSYTIDVAYKTKELVRYYTSSSNYVLCTVWRYNGTSFVRCDPQYYDGSSWKNCN